MPEKLPLSFRYDGQLIHGIPAEWRPTITSRRIDAHILETVYEGAAAGTGLTIRVDHLEYLDFPVVEWTVWFMNTGETVSPLLREIQGLECLSSPGTHRCCSITTAIFATKRVIPLARRRYLPVRH